MYIYTLLLIPIIITIVLYFKYKHEVVWWEYLLNFGVAFLCIFISKLIIEHIEVSDQEYWGSWVTEVRYYEDWNERVSCRHPEYCERYDPCASRDSKGNCKGGTERYQCGWQHPYDVDYHPEYWILHHSDEGVIRLNSSEYDRIVKKFGVTPQFVDMRRRYHTNDGDMYKAIWPGTDHTLEAVITTHRYENRVRVSSSSFAIKKPSKEISEQYKLYDYAPVLDGFKQKVIQGYDDPVAEKKFQILNAKLGRKKQFKAYVLVFKDAPRQAGLYQEDYWEGGNKNELNITIGIDNDGNVEWCHVFSWTDKRDIVVNTRTFVEGQDKLSLSMLADFLVPQVESYWERKSFADFQYLTIEPSTTSMVVSFIVTLIMNLMVAAFVVGNDVTENYNTRRYRL